MIKDLLIVLKLGYKRSVIVLFKNIYWKLDEFSCILVLRNKYWFKNAIPILQSIWNTIQIEKISGFQHRAPKSREKKYNSTENEILLNGNCYIDIL